MKRRIVIALALAFGGCNSTHYVGDNGRGTGNSGGTGGEMPDASLPNPDASDLPTPDGSSSACGSYVAPTPNPSDCPSTMPQSNDSCSTLPTNLSCWYAREHAEVITCECLHQSTSQDQVWYCNGIGPGSGMSSLCPDMPPAFLSSCAGLIGESCIYAANYGYYCAGDSTWRCNRLGPPSLPTQVMPRPAAPPGIDESKQVQQLTLAEAQTWCQWFTGDWGFQPGQAPPDDHGECLWAAGYACDYAPETFAGPSLPYVTGCVERVSMNACVANLRLRPCDATVHDLDDCVMTFWAMTAPGSIGLEYVGEGCFPYQTHASCDQTIVQRSTLPGRPTDCAIPIQ